MTTTVTNPRITISCQFCQTWNRVDSAKVSSRPKCGKCGRPILLDRPYTLNDDTFARTIAESEVPVLVDFYADWCGPCKIMAPHIDQLASESTGKALIAKLNTDLSQRTAESFKITGIPTTIVFRDGKQIERQSGALPLTALRDLLAKAAWGF